MSTGNVDRRARVAAWGFVVAQFCLIGLLVFLPSRSDWMLPGWLDFAGNVCAWCGLGIMLGGAIGLGRGLTAAPLPNDRAQLRTGGLYGVVRHPIYSGLLLFTFTKAMTSGSVIVVGVAVLLVALINVKARWEEQRLAERFPEYPAYAQTTPRFVPWVNSRQPGQ